MQFKQRQQSMKEIAATLGATSVLDGSVRRAGDRVRIVATLIDAASDQHLWAETYDRQMTDIFAIQTDVALHIAAALKTQLTSDEQTRVQRKPTKDLQAYHLFLQGRRCLSKWTIDAVDHAIDCFERAIARDPTFALAYANLSMAHIESAESGARPPERAYARADETVRVALRLDPELSATHCTLGYMKTVRELRLGGGRAGVQAGARAQSEQCGCAGPVRAVLCRARTTRRGDRDWWSARASSIRSRIEWMWRRHSCARAGTTRPSRLRKTPWSSTRYTIARWPRSAGRIC